MLEYRRIAVFGGIYSNHLALVAALEDAQKRGVDAVFCLGDMGAFGPYPDRAISILRDGLGRPSYNQIQCIQGNYDHAIGNELAYCQCGYTDPRDNHFARISYAYTLANTSPANREWLRDLPTELRVRLGNYHV